MAYYTHGKNLLGVLSDGQALPTAVAGTVDSTNMVYVGKQTAGHVFIDLYARTAIDIATGSVVSVELEAFTSNTAASAVPPFSYDNSGTQTAQPNAHLCLFNKVAADGALDWAAGDLIATIAVPGELLDKMNYDWVQLKYNTDEDLSAQTVDAFVYVKV